MEKGTFDFANFGHVLGRSEMKKLMAGSIPSDCGGDGNNICYCYCCTGDEQLPGRSEGNISCDGSGGGDHDCCQGLCDDAWCKTNWGDGAYACALCQPA